MKNFIIEWIPAAKKHFKTIPSRDRSKILKVIESLSDEPFRGKKLQGAYAGYYSLRAWPYRIIYCVKKERLLVLIVDVGHRQGVYR